MNALNREQIKDRMVRLAATHWQVPENEIEANFDPLIILLFDAVAAELEAVGYEIRDIQNNLLHEMAALMLPESLLGARPASCVLMAQPSDTTAILKSDTSFSTLAQIQNPGEPVHEAELNFTPVGEVKLFSVQPGFIRIGHKVYKYLPEGRKLQVHDEQAGNDLVNEIHFTLHGRDIPADLSGLQVFFDLRGHSEANAFYFALQNGALEINGIDTDFTRGYYKNNQYQTGLQEAFQDEGDYFRKVQKEIAAWYADQFITLAESGTRGLQQSSPIVENLPAKLTQEILDSQPLFCTLRLGRHFRMEVLDRLQMGVNAFPAVNRKPEKIFYKTDKWINIIPLPVNDNFLDIQSIEGLGGASYKIRSGNHENAVSENEAIIRTARVGKSTSREIRNTIKNLLETIRDESAYFSLTSNDFISSRLTEISRVLTRMEDQLQISKDEKPSFTYVMLRAVNAGETIQVNYWTTAPKEAAHVKAGMSFRPVQHTLTGTAGTYSLTSAMGGAETPGDYQRKQMLVRQLLSRGKIVSSEDVKLLCYELLGNRLKDMQVRKAMTIQAGRQAGIARVIEIVIRIDKTEFSESELVSVEKQLRYLLDTQGTFMFPFDIRIEDISA